MLKPEDIRTIVYRLLHAHEGCTANTTRAQGRRVVFAVQSEGVCNNQLIVYCIILLLRHRFYVVTNQNLSGKTYLWLHF